jgi:hypothetical protein
MTTIYNYHWYKNYICDSAGVQITWPNGLPRVFAGNPDAVVAFQFVQDAAGGGVEPYPGIGAGATCNFRADNDHANSPISMGASDWVAATGSEYYKYTTAVKPDLVIIDELPAAEGTAGALLEGEFAFVGKSLYVRLVGDEDPGTKPNNFINVVYGTKVYTPPFVECESDKWNQADTWPVLTEGVWTFRTPDITAGECTFELSGNTFQFAARLGQSGSLQIDGQIGIFDTDTDYKIMSKAFCVRNVINPAGPPVDTPSPWLTLSQALQLFTTDGAIQGDVDWTTAGDYDFALPASFVLEQFRAFPNATGAAGDLLTDLVFDLGVVADTDSILLDEPAFADRLSIAMDELVGATTIRVTVKTPSSVDGANGRAHFKGYTI